MDEITTLHTNKCKSYIDFMLSQQQWSGLTKAEIERWLSNFHNLQPNEMLLVYKLLTNVIYFSEKDVLGALREGVYNCVCYKSILEKQKSADFALSQRALANIADDEIRKTYFIPLLDSDAPHESGNYIIRLLVQQGVIPPECSVFVDKLAPAFQSGRVTRLVIVDDCVGSGDQLRGFWNNTTIKIGTEDILLKDLCLKYRIIANYLIPFGYDRNISKIKKEFADLNIYCTRTLSDAQKVFSDNSYIWKDIAERDDARRLFDSISKECRIPLHGYKELDFAFIMHQTIPDWSLPLFWKENADWKLLMRRKNSSD